MIPKEAVVVTKEILNWETHLLAINRDTLYLIEEAVVVMWIAASTMPWILGCKFSTRKK
jgi:hypothetical protein